MLKRKVGDKVFLNPYINIIGTIMDSKEISQPFHPSWDYIVKFNHLVDMGWGLQAKEYYKDDELDKLLDNWNMVKYNNLNKLKEKY
jgi:hypothetical protein